jgi:hypothetical protein
MSEKNPVHSPEYIRSISEQVYRARLAESAGGNDAAWRAAAADRMIEKDDDGGKKFSGRAGAYDPLTRVYLEVMGIKP